MGVVAFNRTLEQELLALARGASLECLVCGEFLLRQGDALGCLECGSRIGAEASSEASSASSQLHLDLQAG